MAQDGKILRSDVSEKDPFQLITESAKVAQIQVENLKKDLELILPSTQKILESKATTVDAINKQAKAMEVLARRQNEGRQAQETLTSSEQAYAKIRINQIKLEQAREKHMDSYEKKLVTQEKQTLRNAKAEERLKSSYFKVQDGLTSLANRYRELAVRKEMGETLSAKEEIRLGRLQVLTLKYGTALKKVDADMGRHQRNVGNYKSGFDGLGHSINQLTREAPAFAVSMSTGFLALSNNIPMLFDELDRIKRVNADIIKQGGEVESVWRKVGKSIFSFNTLISIGVTLLTLYGAQMFKAIGTFFSSANAINALTESKKLLNESTKEGVKNAQEELVRLKVNLGVAKDVSKSYEERVAAVDKLQKEYPAFLGNLSQEAILAGKTKDAENELTTAILQRAKAAAAIGKITENQEKVIELEEKLRLVRYKVLYQEGLVKKAQDRAMQDAKNSTRESTGALDRYNYAQSELNASKREELQIQKDLKALGIVNNRLTQYAIDNTRLLGNEMKNTNDKTNGASDAQKKYNKNFDDYLKLKQKELDLLGVPDAASTNESDAQMLANARANVYEKEYNKILADNTGNQIKQKVANEELLKAKTKLLELEYQIAIIGKSQQEINELNLKLQLELQKLKEKQLNTDEEENKGLRKKGEILKEIAKLTKEVSDIATDYFSNTLQNRIDYFDQALGLVKSNIDYLEDKAAQGSLQAEESLKAQLKLQKELNDEKFKAQQNLAKIQAITAIAGGIGSIAGSIQGFATGTESEIGNYVKPNLNGVGIDNTLVRVHGKERIINGELSKAITGHKTSEVVKGFLNYKQMANGQVGYSVDLSETNRLLKEVASKSVPNWELGEIGQGFMDVVKREVNGNKETVHIYRNKYR